MSAQETSVVYLPGDARRAGPEPDQHRAARQAQTVERLGHRRPGFLRWGGPPAGLDGPADPRRDEDVHLRRATDGPRRPWSGADPPMRDARAKQRAGVFVEFESLGHDRRLPMDREQHVPMLDEAFAGYLGASPGAGHDAPRLERALRRRTSSRRAVVEPMPTSNVAIPTEEAGKDLPPALAALVEERRAAERDAADAAIQAATAILPRRPGARSRTMRHRSESRPSSRTGWTPPPRRGPPGRRGGRSGGCPVVSGQMARGWSSTGSCRAITSAPTMRGWWCSAWTVSMP